MTTLLISQAFPPGVGGTARWFFELYRRLPITDYLVAAGEHPDQAVFDRAHELRLERVPLTLSDLGLFGLSGLTGYWRAFRSIERLVRRHGVKRVHCGRCLPEGWLALLLKRRYALPYACYVHGEEAKLVGAVGADGMMASRQLRWMTRAVLGGAEFVIANSRHSAGILEHEWHIPTERIEVLTPGVDTARFVPADPDPGVRARFGWQDRRVLLTVGRLQKRKGHDRLIGAVREIRERVPDVLYAVVGDGQERGNLERLVAQEGLTEYVQFLGEFDESDLLSCYQQCDLFVLPNRQVGRDLEGFGIVLLEAQACGKAVVAGASGGTAEAMLCPDSGRLVAADNEMELAESLVELLLDRHQLQGMGSAGRRWTVDHFDWSVLRGRAQDVFSRRNADSAPVSCP